MSPKTRWGIAIGRRVVLSLVAFVVTLMLAGDKFKVLSLENTTLFLAAATLAAVTFVDSVLSLFRVFRARNRNAAQARVQKALVALLVAVSQAHNVSIQHLGASVFVPRRRFVAGGRFKRRLETVLVRVVRFRLDDHPQPTSVAWRMGKGAIGNCWKTQRTIHRDWHARSRDYGAADLPREVFNNLGEVERDNFEYTEFVAIARKYSEVLAVPMASAAGQVMGVISIDVALRADLGKCVLTGTDVQVQADTTATLIGEDTSQMYALS